jgi:hypothetical protein
VKTLSEIKNLMLTMSVILFGINAHAQQTVVNGQLPQMRVPNVIEQPMVSSTAQRAHPMASNAQVKPWPSNRGQDWISQWCNDVIYKLSLARQQATQAEYQGKWVDAVNILIGGLREIDLTDSAIRNGPFTAKAVARGIEMFEIVAEATQATPNAPATMIHFLKAYYRFVEYVAQYLDIQFFWTHSQCMWCSTNNLYTDNLFEMNYKQYASKQVEMVLAALAGKSRDAGMYPVYPLGSGEAFLKALEYATMVAAEDLSVSIYNTQYACMIQELRAVSQSIAAFNFADWPRAVAESYYRAERITDALNGRAAYCYRPGYFHHPAQAPIMGTPVPGMGGQMPPQMMPDPIPHTGPVPNGPYYPSQPQYPPLNPPQTGPGVAANLRDMNVYTGNKVVGSRNTEHFDLNGSRFVQKIIVQARGLDAYDGDSLVQVVVNGQDKGTLFVPHAIDPSYSVTIAATTDRISFRHQSGGRVQIQAIVAFYAPYDPTDQKLASATTESMRLDYGSDVRTLQQATTVFADMRGGARYTRSITVEAEGIDSTDAIVEVMVNGDVKQTLYVPRSRKDPTYTVTVADVADRVMFRHVSGGRVNIKDIKAERVR